MTELWWLILSLAIGTYSIRLGGYALGSRLPTTGIWARSFNALPGCLIAALLTVVLVQGSTNEWLAASVALAVAIFSRNLPLTMIAGIAAIWLLRSSI